MCIILPRNNIAKVGIHAVKLWLDECITYVLYDILSSRVRIGDEPFWEKWFQNLYVLWQNKGEIVDIFKMAEQECA